MKDTTGDPLVAALRTSKSTYIERAREVARKLAMIGESLTVDDVRDQCPPPQGSDPRMLGNIFKTNEWRHDGYRKSDRTINHGRPISVFRRIA